MPIFEFVCSSCHHEFDELVRASKAADAITCPSCGSRRAERRLSVFAARAANPSKATAAGPGPCGRCGDPNGPCSL